jgi:serine/threonine-protein kinase RsbW
MDCKVEELSRIRDFVYNRAIHYGFADEEAQKISLAVDEACSNLIKHAFKFDRERQIQVEIEIGKKYFTVKIMDDGVPFNPLSVTEPDMKEYFNEFKRGGLGILIMRKVMDKISYTPSSSKNKKNTLLLKKAFSKTN